MGFTVLETKRLRLRRFTKADLPTLIAYRRDPETQRFQNFGEWTKQDQRDFLSGAQMAELDALGKGL